MSREDIVTKDRSGKLWFVHLATGAEGTINIALKERPRQHAAKYMTFREFVTFAKKKRLRGLPYDELYGPNHKQYGKPQIFEPHQTTLFNGSKKKT